MKTLKLLFLYLIVAFPIVNGQSNLQSFNLLEFTKSQGASYIYTTNPGGYLIFTTGGRPLGEANSNLVLKENFDAYFKGNLGIGVTAPGEKLQVTGTALFSTHNSTGYQVPGNGNAFGQIYFNPLGNRTLMIDGMSTSNNDPFDGYLFKSSYTNANVSTAIGFQSGADNNLVVIKNGKIGFNIVNPWAKISTKGDQSQYPLQFIYDGSNAIPNQNRYYLGLTEKRLFFAAQGDDNVWQRTILNLTHSGNVGIGISDPYEKLEIDGSAKVVGKIKLVDGIIQQTTLDGADNNRVAISGSGGMQTNRGAYFVAYGNEHPDNPGDAWVVPGDGGIIYLAGNVGIGTDNPLYRLDVKGTIRADEVKVNLEHGADFVFSPTYNLPTLTEVETFIKENQHLPDVPPANQMENEGINVAEMNALLLQKIEELTIYTISQQKEIEELKKLNELLIKQNIEIENIKKIISN